MSTYIVTVAKDKSYILENKSDRIYIVDDAQGYEDEISIMLEKDLMTYKDIEFQIKSWGASLEVVTLSQLVNFYKKNKV